MEFKEALKRIEKYRIWMLMLGIFLLAFSLRYISHNQLLYDPDSYLWYRLSQYFAGVKVGEVIERDGMLIDTLSYYPAGRNLGNDLLLLPMAIGYSFKLLGFFGMPQTGEAVMRYMFVFGPLVGALKAVAAFFLMRELTSTRVAAISALFYSSSAASLTRNTAGDTGQESLGGLFIFIWLFLFIKAVKSPAFSREQAIFAAASGLILALANGTWGGNAFYFVLVTVSVLVYLVFKIVKNDTVSSYVGISLSFVVTMAIGIVLSHLLVPLRYHLSSFGVPYILAYFTILVCAGTLISHWLEKKQSREVKPILVLGGILGIFLLTTAVSGKLFTIILNLSDFLRPLVSGVKEDITGPTVSYYRASSLEDFKSVFGVMLLAAPLGAVYLLYEFYKKNKFEALFLIMWLILGALAFKWMIRLSFYLALVVPIVTFVLIDMIALYMGRSADKKSKVKEEDRIGRVAIGIVVILLTLLSFTAAIAQVSSAKMADRGVVPWQDTGLWLKNNTPQNALLIHWWDYGYYMQTFAERRTIVDGGNSGQLIPGGSNVSRNVDVAKFFTSDVSTAYEFIEPYNPENLPVYVLISIEEFPKSGAITHHAGLNKELVELYRKYGIYTEAQYKEIMGKELYKQPVGSIIITYQNGYAYLPEFQNATMVKMLFARSGMQHYKLVHSNDYVFIYEYAP